MNWLDEWPPKTRHALSLLATENEYSSISCQRELSGRSGANTFLALPESLVGRPNWLIVKVGERNILLQDERGLELAKKYFGKAPYVIHRIPSTGPLCGLAIEIAAPKTFEDYYLASRKPQQIALLLTALFENVLRRKDQAIIRRNISVFQMYTWHNRRLFAETLRFLGKEGQELMEWWEEAGRQKELPGSVEMLSHGDLHSRNIMVVNGKPTVIDFGLTGPRHIMRDLAKLEREIRLKLYLHDGSDLKGQTRHLSDALVNLTSWTGSGAKLEVRKACAAVECIRNAARSSLPVGEDWAFEYEAALLIQFLFAAGDDSLDKPRREVALELALDLKDNLVKQKPVLARNILVSREAVLRCVAYSFIRLDQLPSGGWAKSLPNWMEAVWAGDHGTIARNPEMRSKGGTDLTCYALYHFVRLVRPRQELWSRETDRAVELARNNLSSKIGFNGCVGMPSGSRTSAEGTHVRHTLLGLIAFLCYGYYFERTQEADLEIQRTTAYLLNHLSDWPHDDSCLFGMYASATKLTELLKDPDFVNGHPLANLRGKLLRAVSRAASGMKTALRRPISGDYVPRPIGTCASRSLGHLFRPYGDFWRMERSSFLMHLPYLVSEDGLFFQAASRTTAGSSDWLGQRCADCLLEMLQEIDGGFDRHHPEHSLIRYHSPAASEASVPYDWGLSAELCAVLHLPAIWSLVEGRQREQGKDVRILGDKRSALQHALVATFDWYHKQPGLFRFTHGVSFGRYLAVLGKADTDPLLDSRVTTTMEHGVTELELNRLLAHFTAGKEEYARSAIKEMFVEKLQSGEYTPDAEYCSADQWRTRVAKLIQQKLTSFYDGKGGLGYAKRYGNDPIRTFVTRLDDFRQWNFSKSHRPRALDVGCGPGQYAELLKRKGFRVELVDTSKQMLVLASKRLGIKCPPPRDLYRLSEYFKDSTFDLIFACAMMVHVPRERALEVLREFQRVMKPGGVLFVNFKLEDHSLISLDERFFEYYRDHSMPQALLEAADFQIEELTLRWNRRNMYGDPKKIHWANFYCRRNSD